MISSTVVQRETTRRMRRLSNQLGEDVRRLRVGAGISLRQLGAATGLDPSHLARIEAGTVQASQRALVSIGLALGADLSIRYFTGVGPRLHDRFQARMTEEFLRRLDRRWLPRLEVPVSHPVRGVIDVVLDDRPGLVAVASECQSRIPRLEELLRWSAEKADGLTARLQRESKGGPVKEVSRLLILRSTVATREIARRFEVTIHASYPAKTSDVIAALTTSTAPWPGAGIVWMRVDGDVASLMGHPPRGVKVGR